MSHAHRARSGRLRRLGVAVVGVASLATGVAACGGSDGPTTLIGYVTSPATRVGTLTLPDAVNDAPFTFRAEPKHILLAYFGYTQCPDVCPTTLSAVKAALNRLGTDRAARVDLVMTTIDPNRDTGNVLQPYVRSYLDRAAALRTTDDAALKRVADAFGVQYSVTTGTDGKIEVVHTGTLFAIDSTGTIVDNMTFPTPAADIANDLTILLGRAA